MSDKIELLKKVEIKFHELAEERLIRNHHNKNSLKDKEYALNTTRKQERTAQRILQQTKLAEAKKKMI